MELNTIEMYRIDDDGKPAYIPMEILNGEWKRKLEYD